MKRKNREVGGLLQQTLGRRVESCKAKYSSAEEIAKHLRSSYSDYHRTKHQTLIRLVHNALNNTSDNDESDNGESYGKKSKKMDVEQEKEEILQTTTTNSCNSVLASDSVIKKGDSDLASDSDSVMFKDLGGMKNVIEELKTMVLWPIFNPNMCKLLGVKPIGGVLLHGLPGCGKTILAHAIANETGYNFYPTSSTQLVSGISGSSEENIRELFSKAKRTAPSVIFIDEIESIASKRENLQRQMDTRIVTQLMICMDEANGHQNLETRGHVLVIGATNNLSDIESALRRPGRFDREILVPIPDQSSREGVLTVVTRHQKHDNSVDLQKIAMSTPGFVAADLQALANDAGIMALDRLHNQTKHKLSQMCNQNEDWWKEPLPQDDLEKCAITMCDFEEASKKVQPSLTREGFAPIPDVKLEDVGALDHVRQEFDHYLIRRIKHPEDFKGFTRNLETGFLLFGPPGCGKTLIAKAVANEAGANFIHVKGPELLNKFVGISEHGVRKIFSRARTCAPCIIFFDEVDALTKERGSKEGGQNIEGVLNQLLVELDGAENRKGVFVIGATNRFDVIDRAILRPGRFGKHLYVPLPSPDDRVKILKTLARGYNIDTTVDLNVIGRMEGCENYSGADLAELMDVAGMAALIEKWDSTGETSGTIKTCHFEAALRKTSPSVKAPQRKYYQHISKSLKFK